MAKFNLSATSAFTRFFAFFAVLVTVCMFSSCSDDQGAAKLPTLTNVITEPGDTVEVDRYIDKDWTMNIIRINKGDTLDIIVEMENPEEKDTLHAQAVIWAQKTGYQILESEEVLTPKYANDGMSGGRTVKENVTDAGWVDVTKFSYPTEDNNVIYVEVRIDHHKGRPVLRVNDSKIISLTDPSMSTRALYKVKDAPIKADDLLSFETEGFKEDTSFGEEISTSFDRDLMAEDDISGAKEVSHDFEVIDETTDRMWIIERFTMKSGKTNDVERSFLRQRWQKNIDPYELYVNSFAYEFGSVLGMSSFEAEKSLDRGNDNWSGKGKVDMYNANINGEKPVKTQYTFYHETWTYKDKYITVEFPYVSFIVEEAKTAVNGATSDKDQYTKAVLENNINTNYAGYKSSMNELVYLYSKVERKVVEHGFKLNTKKRTWETNRMTPSVVHYKLWNDGVEETTTHEWPLSRALTNGPAFEKICKDNYNRTGNPSITSIKDTDKAFTDDNGGKWTCVEQNGTIGANVEFNGAEGTSITWKFTEHNKVRLEVDGDVIEWGEDLYKFTVKPSLGEGSVSSGYTVYPYTGKLNYIFADAPAKESTDNGVIKVKLPKTLVRSGFTNKKKVWTSTTLTCSATHFDVYSDSSRVETSHKWEVPRSFENGPSFERICKDNTNNTGKPSITNLGKAAKSYTDEKGGKWSGIQESATIGASLEFNGAEKWNLTWTASEYNNIKLQVGDDVLDFGSDTYEFTLNPSLGTSSVKDGYNVWPYTGKLTYKFGDAAAKTGNDTGVIKVKKEKQVKKEGFDDSRKQKIFTPANVTYKAVYVTEWDDNTKDEVSFEWVRERNLTTGPVFERTAKDNTNRTNKPSILDLKSSKKTYTDKSGGAWSGNEEKATIGATVSFNGAEDADVLFYATETNDVQLKYKDAVCDFGHDEYSYTLNPALAAGSVKDGFTVYPYTATLNYVFGTAAAKQATDKGTIKVAVPEEKRFFKKEWGDLEKVEQTTTMSKDMKSYAYVWSLHFYNKETGKRYVLPTILEKDAPQKPLWDFSLVEECEKSKYEKYNSAFFDPRSKTWKNAWAEDAREWLQWSLAEEGSAKKAYGTTVYETAKAKGWDEPSYISGRPTVFTHRYGLTVKDGRLFATDTYNGNAKITDSNCVNGGWK